MHFGYKYVPKLVHFLHHLLYYHQSNLASEQLCVSSSTNMSLLTMGQEHRGTIANIATYDVTRFRTRAGKMIAPDPLIVDYVKRAGFGEVMNLTHTSVDMKFILALCERWRPETHTFHLPMGECTVTLEDVYMLLGLRTNGKAVYGNVQQPNALCVELLGVDLIEGEGQQRGRGQGIKLAGLQEAYVGIQLDQFSDEETILRKTRMYIMLLFGRFLFPEGTGNSVNFMYLCLLGDIDAIKTYSWGSAVLAYLYSSLCKCAKKDVCTFSGCAFLLQTWACTVDPLKEPPMSQQQVPWSVHQMLLELLLLPLMDKQGRKSLPITSFTGMVASMLLLSLTFDDTIRLIQDSPLAVSAFFIGGVSLNIFMCRFQFSWNGRCIKWNISFLLRCKSELNCIVSHCAKINLELIKCYIQPVSTPKDNGLSWSKRGECANYDVDSVITIAAAFLSCMNSTEADDPCPLAAVRCLRTISTILETVSRLPHFFVQLISDCSVHLFPPATHLKSHAGFMSGCSGLEVVPGPHLPQIDFLNRINEENQKRYDENDARIKESLLVKKLLEQSKLNKEKNSKEIENKYCLRGAEWGVCDCSAEGMTIDERDKFIAMLKDKVGEK
ncbi:uncharacterized protein LOC131657472 [Vicia villosa]|uniref:uncharacterized protein LOC131657472 n=1 Tax=Vicia villosa TaxID=3911 RepID=UPI00273AC451|nr:uncharacterized protein LOC131657472 [Vicia villosa]